MASTRGQKNSSTAALAQAKGKARWNEDEDKLLREVVKEWQLAHPGEGTISWVTVAPKIPCRNAKQCRER